MAIKTINRRFISGLLAILPLVATLGLLYWLVITAESLLGGFLRMILPELLYFPGLGLLAALGLVFLVGFLLDAWLFRKLIEWADGLMARIPLVRSIYMGVRDFADYFSEEGRKKNFNRAVVVHFGEGRRLMGLVTREDFEALPDTVGKKGDVAVYLPMSFQIGGYTLMLPAEQVETVDMNAEDALKYILTGGITRKAGDGL